PYLQNTWCTPSLECHQRSGEHSAPLLGGIPQRACLRCLERLRRQPMRACSARLQKQVTSEHRHHPDHSTSSGYAANDRNPHARAYSLSLTQGSIKTSLLCHFAFRTIFFLS